ncbi:tbc1 domain family member gtpase-activating protein [Holotrichia oblita]|uniref:Tbc1 domain family member gtpase-activating protein n=1 Tax=Holotrichia oblita TaxID=644536 RepID=A0ACB9TB59_HOLOL|nr:tbc1 domain family member gtpase-activating protein [Holotrichia oblita]
MDQNEEKVEEIFVQEGVLLLKGPTSHMEYMKLTGTLYITRYEKHENEYSKIFIEWKPNENLTIDSDIQDQEWAVVNTVEKRTRTLSGSLIPEEANRSKYLRVNFDTIKSFKVADNGRRILFNDGSGDTICTFSFQNGNSTCFIASLRQHIKTAPSRRDKNLYIVMGELGNNEKQIETSFKTLSLFPDDHGYMWNLVRNFPHRPYETTMEAFSKVANIGNYFWNFYFLEYLIVYNERPLDDETKEVLNKSIIAIESATTTHTQDDYEVIANVPKLPDRKDCPRSKPLTKEQWLDLQNCEGKIEDVDGMKLLIFRGTQWMTMTKTQEDNFSDYRERKSLIEKDVNRTDRAYDFYAGDNNPHLQLLNDILMTYVMYNFDLGYVQGMSDLLSPILYLLQDEVDAFWCFVGFMEKVLSNFDIDQAGMKEQLQHLHTLLAFTEPELSTYLDNHDSGNMFFCFRWLLVWFKRELSQEDVMKLWEVLWTGLPCQNFHLLICLAILETEKRALMDNNYGFTEILKHINELSLKLNVSFLLNKAEGIYRQIEEATHANDSVRDIVGLPKLENGNMDSPNTASFTYLESSADHASVNIDTNEVCYERGISNSYL